MASPLDKFRKSKKQKESTTSEVTSLTSDAVPAATDIMTNTVAVNPRPIKLNKEEQAIVKELEDENTEPAIEDPLAKYKLMKKKELLDYCLKANIPVAATAKKAELITAIEEGYKKPIEDKEEEIEVEGPITYKASDVSIEVEGVEIKGVPIEEPATSVSFNSTVKEAFVIVLGQIVTSKYIKVNSLHPVIEELAKKIEKTNDVPHWSLVEYGKGGALLAAHFKDWAEGQKGFWYLDPHTKEAQALRGVIHTCSDAVILGTAV